jgi:hypothetical protein
MRVLQRSAAHIVARQLRTLAGENFIDDLLADDLITGISVVPLHEENQSYVLSLMDGLTRPAAVRLSKLLANYEIAEGEDLEVLQLRLRALVKHQGAAPAPSEMQGLDERPISRDIIRDWLFLNPPAQWAIELVDHIGRSPKALRTYASQLSVADRSSLWIAAESAKIADPGLIAIGGEGIDAAAVKHIAATIESKTRQPERDQLIQRLTRCEIAETAVGSVRKAASELALTLLARPASGDSALAGRLIVWAGGAAQGYVQRIRTALAEAADDKSALSKTIRRDLEGLGLLNPPKKSRMDRLLGR